MPEKGTIAELVSFSETYGSPGSILRLAGSSRIAAHYGATNNVVMQFLDGNGNKVDDTGPLWLHQLDRVIDDLIDAATGN